MKRTPPGLTFSLLMAPLWSDHSPQAGQCRQAEPLTPSWLQAKQAGAVAAINNQRVGLWALQRGGKLHQAHLGCLRGPGTREALGDQRPTPHALGTVLYPGHLAMGNQHPFQALQPLLCLLLLLPLLSVSAESECGAKCGCEWV